jgi:hypothetical protein
MTGRVTHPLKAWRLTQTVWDDSRRCYRAMTVSDAARRFGVSVQSWFGWEKYEDEPGARVPERRNGTMRRLHEFTNGQVRPDHFHILGKASDRRTTREMRKPDAPQQLAKTG